MKKTLYTIIITGIMAISFISCRVNNTPAPAPAITGKWTMKSAIGHYIVLNNDRRDTTNFTANDYFDFKADGTLTISASNVMYNGNWQITNNKLLISGTNYIDYSSGFTIQTLNSSQLQIFYTTTDTNSLLEQTLKLTK